MHIRRTRLIRAVIQTKAASASRHLLLHRGSPGSIDLNPAPIVPAAHRDIGARVMKVSKTWAPCDIDFLMSGRRSAVSRLFREDCCVVQPCDCRSIERTRRQLKRESKHGRKRNLCALIESRCDAPVWIACRKCGCSTRGVLGTRGPSCPRTLHPQPQISTLQAAWASTASAA